MKKRFTVVTPNLNMARYLRSTIESVLRNLDSVDEYFIIDGGSNDGSVEIISEYSDRVTGWISEPDRGYADAIHKGFMRGAGDYYCWINSGDVLLSGALEMAEASLLATDADMIFGDDFYINDQSRVLGFSSGTCSNLMGAMVFGGWTPLQDACFWRGDLYRKTGGLDISLRSAADYDLFARFSVAGTTQYVPYAFSAFRRHEGQHSIAHSMHYRREKDMARRRLIGVVKGGVVSKSIRRAWYLTYARWRARVLHRWWDIPELHGRDISTLTSGKY